MSVLKIKDENGNWIGVTTIKGEKGEKGEPGGFVEHAEAHSSGGTDPITPESIGAATSEEVASHEAQLSALFSDNTFFWNHLENKNNPHGVTAERVGAAKSDLSNVDAVPIQKGGTGATTVEGARASLGAASTVLYTTTIPASGWSESSPYTLDVTVGGILSTDVPIIDVVLPSDTSTAKQIIEEWAKVGRVTTALDKITVYCYDEAPSVALPIQLKVVR